MAKLTPAMEARKWRKGESGNPSGRSGEYQRCQAICRGASQEAAEEVIRLCRHSNDDRVRLLAAQWIYERAWGKAPESDTGEADEDRPSLDVSKLSPEQRDQLRGILATATVHPPLLSGEAARAREFGEPEAGVAPQRALPAPYAGT
jgi:hypothetical protein